MRVRRIGAITAAAAAATLVLSSCGLVGGSAEYESILQKAEETGTLVIGVKYDQPGLGLETPEGPVGFDVDVATYVAGQLGVTPENIEWVETASSNREPFLEQGQVDLVFATYSITEERQDIVSFGGPYYVAQQDILVAADNNDINSPEDLADQPLCSASGSRSAETITETMEIPAQLREAGNYSECIELLSGGSVAAVTTDNIILAGFAAQRPGELRMLNQPFQEERYGVGMPHGDTETCEAVNAAIAQMWEDGSAAEFLENHFGETDFAYAEEQPDFEPCPAA
ncbi:glutamate ABC transporter substrate-binding protein [Allonocardiopsis opalescens]|uniref:Amino acid ABC transporter substrate-binding protein (PAAT family) n=1 Tax=Allonocardiopsis opalescens TaxID=1144618 RepID=A0A2T0QFE3_9ACTN|nr:glutamate ABC transporter substrate-binding protein [Allonocardiopsis opalescens]PRY02657.1 amino acid ABC transporter substrate-binding protein (PAAT family) [Allonocardiopsis opalescens]